MVLVLTSSLPHTHTHSLTHTQAAPAPPQPLHALGLLTQDLRRLDRPPEVRKSHTHTHIYLPPPQSTSHLCPSSLPSFSRVVVDIPGSMRLHHKCDVQFKTPKCDLIFDFQSPEAYASPENAVMTR